MLTEQVEQYTKEMEKNTFIIEDLKNELQRNKGNSMLNKYIKLFYVPSNFTSIFIMSCHYMYYWFFFLNFFIISKNYTVCYYYFTYIASV